MVVFPNAKINLGLNVVRKMENGYHYLETIFYPVAKKDALEIIPADSLQFTTSGLPVPGSPENNLCLKAYHLLKADFDQLPPVHIHLHKAIPMGAGLGGGSANAAFMLLMLNNRFELGLNETDLLRYALLLGSDCPFFILNKPAFASERGEVLSPVDLDLSNFTIVLVHAGVHVSTAAAFAQLTPAPPKRHVLKIISQPVETWRQELVNDFEASVFIEHPQLSEIKNQLYAAGAVYAAMTGTGSTIYGLFRRGEFRMPKFNEVYSVDVLN